MIGCILVFSHLFLRKLGFARAGAIVEGRLDTVCGSHEGGARPPGSPGGPPITGIRQPGGNDDPTPSGVSDLPRYENVDDQTNKSTSVHDLINGQLDDYANDVDTVVDSSSLPVVAIEFESILEPRNDSTALAEFGSIGCDFMLDSVNHLLLNPDIVLVNDGRCGSSTTILSSVNNGNNTATILDVDTLFTDSPSVGNLSDTENVDSQNHDDLTASGDGSSTPMDMAIDEEEIKKGKSVNSDKNEIEVKTPPAVMDEVISVIMAFDEIKTGDGQPLMMGLNVGEKMKEGSPLMSASSKGDNLTINFDSLSSNEENQSPRDQDRIKFKRQDKDHNCSNLELYLIEEEQT